MSATANINAMAGHRKLVIQINPLFFSTKSRFITSKRRHLRIFLAKGANHPHPRDVFAHPFRELGIKRLDFLEALVNFGAEEFDPHGNQRQGGKRHQRQLPIQVNHQADRGDADHHRGGGIHDARANHVANGIQVVGEL